MGWGGGAIHKGADTSLAYCPQRELIQAGAPEGGKIAQTAVERENFPLPGLLVNGESWGKGGGVIYEGVASLGRE